MPWNNGGPGPWGKPSGSGGDGDKKPTPGPWGNPGANKGGNGDGGGERPDPDRGPRRPGGPFGGGGGPFGGGGGPFGGGNQPDLDRLIAQAQGYIRSLLGGGSGRGSGGRGFGGFANSRGLVLLLLAVVVLWVGSGFYRVQPDEQGVVLRFGAYSYWTPPGLHWHVPWPVEEVELPTVTRINRTEIGYRSAPGGNVEAGQDTAGRDVLAESLMLTGDENIIDIDVAVFWRINDALGVPVQHRQSGNAGARGGGKLDAGGDRPHADPARPRTIARPDRGRRPQADPGDPGPLQSRGGDHPGAVAEGRSAGRGDRKFPRRPARQHRRRADAQRGRVLPQRHRAARPR